MNEDATRFEHNVEVCFVGDISLNGGYRNLWKQGRRPFEAVSKLIGESAFLVGNLECMCAGGAGENLRKRPRLVTDEQTLGYLRDIGVSHVTLAHNHVYDHLEDGFIRTVERLQELGIGFLGAGLDDVAAKRSVVLERDGVKVALLAFVSPDTNPHLPESSRVSVNVLTETEVKRQVREVRDAVDHIVLLLHWGGRMEKALYPDVDQIRLARAFIDAGVDLIIGHHSHTLQPFEIYRGKHIFYSLGNFCFSDFTFEGKLHAVDRTKGTETVMVSCRFAKTGYQIRLYPIRSKDLHLDSDPAVLRRLKWRNYAFKWVQNGGLLWKCYHFKFRYLEPVYFHFFSRGVDLRTSIGSLNMAKVRRFLSK
jgi:poly-gamma-glutamate synthesis protein (capsule biosynthesis protein)